MAAPAGITLALLLRDLPHRALGGAGRQHGIGPERGADLACARRGGLPADRLAGGAAALQLRLIDGEVDAISAYSSNEPYFLEAAGLDFQVYTPRSAGIDFYGDNLFASEALLRRNPALVNAFREASLRGWRYALDHPDEIARLG